MIVSAQQTFGSPHAKMPGKKRISRGAPGGRRKRSGTLRELTDHPRGPIIRSGIVLADDPVLHYAGIGSFFKKVKKAVSIKNVVKGASAVGNVVKKVAPIAAFVTPLAPVAAIAAGAKVASAVKSAISPAVQSVTSATGGGIGGLIKSRIQNAFNLAKQSGAIPSSSAASITPQSALSSVAQQLLPASSTAGRLVRGLAPYVPPKSAVGQTAALLQPGTAYPGESLTVDGMPATVATTPGGQLVATGGLPSWVLPAGLGVVALLLLTRRGR